jgi:ketosteroid isomerase-like protein
VQILVDSELAFARTAADQGIKKAFLTFLADHSVLFRPRAVPGKKWMEERPPTPGLLSWKPSYAETSGAGDIGFTTGPFTYTPPDQQQPSGYGQFFSIWEKQSDDSWKVVLDAGIEHDKIEISDSLQTKSGTGSIVSSDKLDSEKRKFESLDAEFSQSLHVRFAAEDVMVLRNGYSPSRGTASLQYPAQKCSFQRELVRVASSADLAYTFGEYKCSDKAGVYVRVWRKEDNWKLALDYMRDDP